MEGALEGPNAFVVIIAAIMALVFFVGPLYAVPALFLLVLLGAFWSPFAAAICGRIARKRGLIPGNEYISTHGNEYIKAGFASSFWLFVPWLYLVYRMIGKPLAHRSVIVAYAILFPLWMYGTWVPAFGLSWTFFRGDDRIWGPFDKLGEGYELSGAILTSTIAIAVPVIALILWAVLLWQMIRIYRNYRRGALNPAQSASIEPVYLRPFKYTAATFVLTWVAVIYIAITMLLNGW